MTLVFMFPGQSSRHPEMFERLRDRPAAVRAIEEASDILGRDLFAHYRRPDAFATNRDVQIGVFVANHAHLRSLEARGVVAHISLGLSLGEYNHLVHIGAIAFADALRLVEARGEAYDAGPRGEMVSVFPLPLEELEPIATRSGAFVANMNSPGQNVIAGSHEAVAAAVRALEDMGCECVPIEKNVPMHTPMFEPAAEIFRPALRSAKWRRAPRPYLPNVTGAFETFATPERIVELLALHVHSPVRWRHSIDLVADGMNDAVFVEVGPRAVLYNLLSRSWRKVPRLKTDGDIEEIVRAA